MKQSNLTNANFQSKVLPIIEVAETEIKKLVNYYALYFKSRQELITKINGIIRAVNERLPISLFEREKYIFGLKQTAEKMVRDYYDKVVDRYKLLLALLLIFGVKVKADNPMELNKQIKVHQAEIKEVYKTNIDVVSMQKGFPNVENYQKELAMRMRKLAETQTVSSETGKKPISLWQKAELDLRHEHQIDMIQSLQDRGVRYAWTSTHPDCSKRCEKWQGKLFDIQADHSELSGHRMRNKVDGNTVYCFKEVINQIDKYGYTNNIIVGFNCRHKLVPYKPNSVPPQEYTKEQVKRNREINQTLRQMEREIRLYKQQSILYNSIDKSLARKYKLKAEQLMAEYKKFANENGYAWYEWRVRV